LIEAIAIAVICLHYGALIDNSGTTMPLNLSIKNAPDEIVDRLRVRAKRHHRSLQGELMAIIEQAVFEQDRLTPVEAYNKICALGLRTQSESVGMIRADRDAR
jgi:plasmid stability protein